MKRRTVQSVLRWMLAAWTLMASALVTPTVVHSHSGGQSSHDHDTANLVLPAVSHSLMSDVFDYGYEDEACLPTADSHHHGCLPFLGTVTYLPTPKESHRSHGHPLCVWETTLVVSSAQGSRVGPCSGTVDDLQLTPVADFSAQCDCQAGKGEAPTQDDAPSTLLCDRARHERSGVLLT